jgi:hypothetical protein
MTQTPSRDWQKDMEIAEQLKLWDVDPGGEEDGAAFYTMDADGIYTTVRADNMLGKDAELLHEALYALPYWLQEAKKQFDLAEELNNEVFSANCERETFDQTIKGGLERALKTTDPYEMLKVIQSLYRTLYPDTPAPTQTAGIKVKCIRDNYSGEGKLSFISGKTYEADKTDGDIIVVNEQGSRHIIKTETGLHEFFSTYFEFITPAPKEGSHEN